MKRTYHVGMAGPWQSHNPDLTPATPLRAGTGADATGPCNNGMGPHEGPLVMTEEFDAHAESVWHGTGVCASCGSNVHRNQLRKLA